MDEFDVVTYDDLLADHHAAQMAWCAGLDEGRQHDADCAPMRFEHPDSSR